MSVRHAKKTRRAPKAARASARAVPAGNAAPDQFVAVRSSGKTERLQLRMTLRAKNLIRMAAAVHEKDVTEFMVDAAVRASEETLADRRIFLVDDCAWRRFTAALDKPVSPRLREQKPNLARLLSERSIFER